MMNETVEQRVLSSEFETNPPLCLSELFEAVRLQIGSSQGVGYNEGFIAMMNRGCAGGGEMSIIMDEGGYEDVRQRTCSNRRSRKVEKTVMMVSYGGEILPITK